MDLEEARALYAQGKRDLKLDEASAREAQRRLMARRKFLDSLIELHPEIAASEIDPDFEGSNRNRMMHGVGVRVVGEDDAVRRLGEDTGPRGKMAALEVLRSRPDTWVTVRAMTEELINRGWMSAASNDPEAAARQSLYRLEESNRRVEREMVDGVLSFRYRRPRAATRPGMGESG